MDRNGTATMGIHWAWTSLQMSITPICGGFSTLRLYNICVVVLFDLLKLTDTELTVPLATTACDKVRSDEAEVIKASELE